MKGPVCDKCHISHINFPESKGEQGIYTGVIISSS